MNLVRVIVNAGELVKNCIEIVDTRGFCIRELRKNHYLDLTIKVEVDVVELGSSITDSLAVDSELSSDSCVLRIKLDTRSGKLLWIRKRVFRA